MSSILSKVRGHEAVLAHFKDWVLHERVPSFSIFAGPDGVGKFLSALGLAQSLICEKNGCGECGVCWRVGVEQNENLMVIRPEQTQIKVDQARDVLRFLHLQALGRARVVIIDSAETMNPTAGNLLLKTLEEPPAKTYFIFITSRLSAILPTIRSRAQVLHFGRLSNENLQLIHAADDWLLDLAQGSAGELLRLTERQVEMGTMRELALNFLEAPTAADRWELQNAIKESSGDKQKLLWIPRFWQRHFAAQARGQGAPQKWLQLFDEAVRVERELLAHIDRGLLFEDLAQRYHREIGA